MDDNSEKIAVRTNNSAAPAAPPAPPAAPSTPVSPNPPTPTPAPPGPDPSSDPDPVPPTPAPMPQAVVSSDSPAAPPPPPVVSGHGGGKKRWLKIFIIVLLLAAIAGAGWYFFVRDKQESKQPATTQSSTIPLLKIGVLDPDYGELYPKMTPSSYATMVNSQMFEGLVRYEDKSKIVPALATTWSNPDDKTWLFTIAKNVKFHDGHTLTPEDVKYSLDTIIATGSDYAQLFADSIEAVTVEPGGKVKITTKQADPVLLNKLAFLYIIDSKLPKGSEPSQAGTGPYFVKPGTKPTQGSVEMVAFKDYRLGKPNVEALDFGSDAEPDDLVQAFKDGEYDIAGPFPADDAKDIKNAFTFTSSEPNVDYIGFNTVKPGAVQNKLVREAIRYAVNAQEVGDATGSRTTPISQMIPPSIAGYNPAIKPYKQNIEKAKQLLAQAGYPNGLTVRFSVSADSSTTKVVVDNLKAAGITATLDSHEDFDQFINYFSTGQADMYKVNYSSDTLDGLDVLTTTLDKANYNNPKFEALTAQAATATDPAKRLKLLQEAETLVDQDVAVVPLFSGNEIWLMDKNYTLKQDMPSSFISVYFYNVRQK